MFPKDKPIRWGIFGCGFISNDFCVALSALPSNEHVIEHIADEQDVNRAKEYAARFAVEKYSDRFVRVAEDIDVDVCYVGVINSLHKDLSIMAMKHGKAVLCEKPVTLNSQDLSEVIHCAVQNGVLFMEALSMRCFPLYRSIQSKLKDGHYGEPNVLIGTIGFGGLFDSVARIKTPELGGGALIDIGIYLLTVTDMVFEGYKMKDVKICAHLHENGIDRSGDVTVLFEGNKTAHLIYNADYQLSTDVKIICSRGNIYIPKPFHYPEWYSEEFDGASQIFDFSLPPPPKKMSFPNSMGLRFEAQHFRECLTEGKMESPLIPHSTSRRIIALLDNLKDQMKTNAALT